MNTVAVSALLWKTCLCLCTHSQVKYHVEGSAGGEKPKQKGRSSKLHLALQVPRKAPMRNDATCERSWDQWRKSKLHQLSPLAPLGLSRCKRTFGHIEDWKPNMWDSWLLGLSNFFESHRKPNKASSDSVASSLDHLLIPAEICSFDRTFGRTAPSGSKPEHGELAMTKIHPNNYPNTLCGHATTDFDKWLLASFLPQGGNHRVVPEQLASLQKDAGYLGSNPEQNTHSLALPFFAFSIAIPNLLAHKTVMLSIEFHRYPFLKYHGNRQFAT